jgi:hypothetical protein
MRFDRLKNNYNGFIHPRFLAHLKPRVRNLPATLEDMDLLDSNASEWAADGFLTDVNLISTPCIEREAFIIKGLGRQLAEIVRNEEDVCPLQLPLDDYYFGDPDQSLSVLLDVLRDSDKLVYNLEIAVALCIEDLGFHDSLELEEFITKNLHGETLRRVKFRLELLFLHYIRHPEDIWKLEYYASNTSDWLKCAKLWSQLEDESSARRCLENGQKIAGNNFYAWQQISRSYLFLLGDFDQSAQAMTSQINCCTYTYHWLQSVMDLCSYVGTKNALSKATELMTNAEFSIDDPEELIWTSDVWKTYLKDPERAIRCRKIPL